MALGSNPSEYDGTIDLWVEADSEFLFLKVLRPAGIQGIHYSFDLGSELSDWTSTLGLPHQSDTEDAENGFEVFRVAIPITEIEDISKQFIRLRVRLADDQA